jgi:hypothetical protein
MHPHACPRSDTNHSRESKRPESNRGGIKKDEIQKTEIRKTNPGLPHQRRQVQRTPHPARQAHSSRNSPRHGFSIPDPSLDHNPPGEFVALRANTCSTSLPAQTSRPTWSTPWPSPRWRALLATQACAAVINNHPPVKSSRLPIAFENSTECHLMRYEATFRRHLFRALARLMDLRHSREQRKQTKIACDLRTQEVIESKSTAPTAEVRRSG